MILIGERINGMFKNVKQAIADKNKKDIQELAVKQTQAGATYLDVNVGTAAADQEGTMAWLVETIQEVCSSPLSLDSQKPSVIAAGLKVANTENGIILNSTPLNKKSDEEIFDKYVEMANQAGPKASIIALTMDKNGVPQDIDTRVAIAADIVSKAMEVGFDGQSLSNLSQGASARSLINRIFLTMAISRGLDSAIVDVFDQDLMNAVATAEMLMNKQIYSDSFLKVYSTSAT
ncbi:MAG: dihydropteroate synthase [Sedimentisphaerales bacterium]